MKSRRPLNISKYTNQIKAVNYVENESNYLFVKWALELMKNGIESENLHILAGLNINESEDIEFYYNRTLDELGIEVIQNEEVLQNVYALWIYEKMQESELTAREAIRKMWNLCRLTKFHDRFSDFHNLSQDIESIEYGEGSVYDQTLNTKNFEEKVKEAFEKLSGVINNN